MSASVRIQGGSDKAVADLHTHNGQPRGLVVYNDNLNNYTYDVKYLTNPTYGRNVNQDPTALTPTSVTIHDGGDTAAWTPTNLSGSGFDFAGTTQVFAGTRSIDATASSNNNIASFSVGFSINPALISFLRMRIYIESWDGRGTKDVQVQWADASTLTGAAVNLSDYIDTTLTGTWQLVDIPISDFQITTATVNELRIQTLATGPGQAPDYHLDNIEYLAVSGSVDAFEFRWDPEYGDTYYVLEFKMTALTSGKTTVDTDEFFGITALTNGIELVLRDEKTIYAALDARTTFDLLSWGHVELDAFGGNNKVTQVISFQIPDEHMTVIGKRGMYIVLRVRDDLSGIDKLTCSVTLSKLEN